METCSVARRLSSLILVVTVSVIGIPLPVRAAGEDRVTATRHRGLTFNGRPLSEFVALPAPLQTVPDNRRRVSADEFFGGAAVTESFEALNAILEPGYEVVVWDEEGRKTRGRVLSISGEEVVVTRRRLFFGRFRSLEELVFGADSITRVEIVDSTWNGIAIGTVVGTGLVFGLWQAVLHTKDDDAAFLYAYLAGGALVLRPIAGHEIDLAINESIYERPSPAPRVTVAPLIGRDQKGLAVRVGF